MVARRTDWVAAMGIGLMAVILPGPWGPNTPQLVPSEPETRDRESIARGAALYRRYDCVRCHSLPRTGSGVNIPPSLANAGSRSRTEWMAAYLLDPAPLRYSSEGARPDLVMPAIDGTVTQARDLASFLGSMRDPERVPPIEEDPQRLDDPDLRAEGHALFDQYQCLGCHQLHGSGGQIGPSLDGVGRRRQPAYIAALLRDPQRVIPGTAMDDKDLWSDEVLALTAFLSGLDDEGQVRITE